MRRIRENQGCKWIPNDVFQVSHLIMMACRSSLFFLPNYLRIIIIISTFWVDPITQKLSNLHLERENHHITDRCSMLNLIETDRHNYLEGNWGNIHVGCWLTSKWSGPCMRSEDVNYSLTETTPSFTRSVQSHLGEVVFVELPEHGECEG